MALNQIKDKKQLMLAVAYYTGGSIFGPLVVFGGIGYYLDIKFGTKPLYMLIGVGAAFVVTNILVVKKTRELIKNIVNIASKDNSEKNERNNLN